MRIALGDIETVLRQAPGVFNCAVALRPDAAGAPRLVGYYIEAAGGSCQPAKLAHYVAERLPDDMVPLAWMRLDALPMTGNAKLDRKALPVPDSTVADSRSVTNLPNTAVARTIAEIWSDVLGIDPIGVDDNIFTLGADSIHNFRIAARMIEKGVANRGLPLSP